MRCKMSVNRMRIIPAWAGNTPSDCKGPRRKGDHPRVGGEHAADAIVYQIQAGSSPRGRGTRDEVQKIPDRNRIIPAWAGNTSCAATSPKAPGDHPRVGGEHCGCCPERASVYGSSPRGRGTLRFTGPARPKLRIIPAWAGNTLKTANSTPRNPDHPRVGGEHMTSKMRFSFCSGSSPRGRGTQIRAENCVKKLRIIPAWAGNTWRHSQKCNATPDHPRVGGEHRSHPATQDNGFGSSPRGRGTLAHTHPRHPQPRIIPAWAGNTIFSPATCRARPDHPRVGGEHNHVSTIHYAVVGSSPRGRGTRQPVFRKGLRVRIIPAWAGNTRTPETNSGTAADHPRVGGEHLMNRAEMAGIDGSSPRGRGTRET